MTEPLRLRPALPPARDPEHRLLGHRPARAWIGALQLRARQGTAGRLVRRRASSRRCVVTSGAALVAFLVTRVVARSTRSSICASSSCGRYATGVFLMTTLGFVLYGSLVLLPILLQTLLGYPSLQAGIAMAPRGLGSFIGMPRHRPADRQDRCTQDGDRGPRARGADVVLAWRAESERRLLGYLLAAVLPGPGVCRCSSCR